MEVVELFAGFVEAALKAFDFMLVPKRHLTEVVVGEGPGLCPKFTLTGLVWEVNRNTHLRSYP